MSSEEKPTTNEAEDFTAEIQPVQAELADPHPDDSSAQATVISAASSNNPETNDAANSITEFFESKEPQTVISGNIAAATIATHRAPPPLAKSLQNLSANGGAVGALVLGLWCFVGSFITNWSIVNGFLGLILGFWGLTSRRQTIAWIGIGLCLIGIFLSLADISALVNEWMNPIDENSVEL